MNFSKVSACQDGARNLVSDKIYIIKASTLKLNNKNDDLRPSQEPEGLQPLQPQNVKLKDFTFRRKPQSTIFQNGFNLENMFLWIGFIVFSNTGTTMPTAKRTKPVCCSSW